MPQHCYLQLIIFPHYPTYFLHDRLSFLCVCFHVSSFLSMDIVLGFTGKICDTEIDECNSDPCQNGGKCVDQVASFLCICPQGYTGVVCENIMEECQDWTCLNNGTCHKVSGQSLCQCTPYYTGPDCGKGISPGILLICLCHSFTFMLALPSSSATCRLSYRLCLL